MSCRGFAINPSDSHSSSSSSSSSCNFSRSSSNLPRIASRAAILLVISVISLCKRLYPHRRHLDGCTSARKETHPPNVDVLLVPGNLARLALQLLTSKHLVRAEAFSTALLATAASPFPRHDDDVLLAFFVRRGIRHESPCPERQTLQPEPWGVNVACGAAACARAVCARYGCLEAAQQARHFLLHLLRRVGKRRRKELRCRLDHLELA